MQKIRTTGLLLSMALVAGCGAPDLKALQKLACQQASASIDLQSVSQIDTLRKALGLAPGVDPLGTCRALGVAMEPQPRPGAQPQAETESEANQDR